MNHILNLIIGIYKHKNRKQSQIDFNVTLLGNRNYINEIMSKYIIKHNEKEVHRGVIIKLQYPVH